MSIADSKAGPGLVPEVIVGGPKAPPPLPPKKEPSTALSRAASTPAATPAPVAVLLPRALPVASPATVVPPTAADTTTPPAAEPVTAPSPSSPQWTRRLLALPSWLVSTVFHLLALIALGLLTLPTIISNPPETIVAALGPDTEFELNNVTLDVPKLDDLAPSAVAETPLGDMLELGAPSEDSATQAPVLGDAPAEVDSFEVGFTAETLSGTGRGLKQLAGGDGTAEFFGVKAGGRRFVFVVDSSNSMRGRKFEDAKRELIEAVSRLTKKQAFYVIFFDWDAQRMFVTDKGEPELRPVLATEENKQKLEYWLPLVKNELKTHPYEAVKFALEMSPDAIYILSDGEFTDRGRTVEFLKQHNIIRDPAYGDRPKTVIHTIAFYSRDGEVTMQAIAKAYRGTYRFVPPPGKR